MAIDYPPVFINNYLAEKIPAALSNYFASDLMKFFPTQPTTIDTFTEEFPESADEPFAVYDRMFRMRRKPFPHIKTEQVLYYFYKTSGGIDALIETVQLVQDLLDNGDESAADLNSWISGKAVSSAGTPVVKAGIEHPTVKFFDKDFFLPYFHETKLYQLEESRDIIDFGTARTYAGSKMIIEYDWHKSASKVNVTNITSDKWYTD